MAHAVSSRPACAAAVALAAAIALALGGCGRDPKPDAPGAGPSAGAPQTAPRDPADGKPQGGFVELAIESGIPFHMDFLSGEQGANFKTNLYDHGCGVAIADIDGDGDDDVYFCNQLGRNALYRNDGGGRFTDVSKASGTALGDRICVMSAFGDYDSDGDQDLFVTSTRGGNVLFRNDGTGKFEDVTAAAGLTFSAHSETPAFFDMDGDGDLDLFVSNTAKWTYDTKDPSNRYYEGVGSLTELVGRTTEPNVMYRNEGNGRFTDVTAASGLAGAGWGGDVAVWDFDDDGDLDLFVANMFGQSLLYRNDGRGRFTPCTPEVFGRTSWGAVGAKAFDYDVDGRLDLLLIDMHSDMWIQGAVPYEKVQPTVKYPTALGPSLELGLITEATGKELLALLRIEPEKVVFGTTLFRNLGDGKFEETSDRAGVETFFPWSAGVGDYDCDGSEDVFIATGMGHPFRYWPASLLMNDGHGKFTNRAKELGIDPPPGGEHIGGVKFLGKEAAKSSRATAVADFDGDGRLDIAVNNFNDRAHLFRNLLPKRHWVSFRLKATRGHPDAVGALVTLKAGGRTMVRQVNTSGGYLSQGSRALHFGLGDNVKIESCEIRWPGGLRQTLTDVGIDEVHAITEPTK